MKTAGNTVNEIVPQPIPETSRDHVNAHGDGMDMESEMPGMMTGEDMDALEKAKDSEFQAMWLEMMIEHHEGAISMAKEEQGNGKDEQAVAMAEDIAQGQTDEVAIMRGLLAR